MHPPASPSPTPTSARRGNVTAHRLGLLGLLLAAAALTGCFGPRNFTNENDKLRAENLAAKKQIAKLNDQLSLCKGQVSALQQKLHHQQTATNTPAAGVPELSRITLGKYSGFVPEHPQQLRLYLLTQDQQGRFLPVAGKVTLRAVTIPDQGKPELLAEKTFDPNAFDAAYRASLLGTHYTLTLSLPSALSKDTDRVTVKIIFTQARTGVKLTAEQTFAVKHK